jgi:hypothetical protein
MQSALIVKGDEIVAIEPKLQLKPRLAQKRLEASIGCVEWTRSVRGQTQRCD